jgi:hypothetical protein
MKKTPFIKVITIIILAIAAFSLIFGSAIMLLGNSSEQEQEISNPEYTEIETNENINELETYEISAEDNNVEIEVIDENIE